MIKIEDYDYQLPSELIAQEALKNRDECRLLVVDRENNDTKEGVFKDIASDLGEDDVLVLNESRVFPARLIGKKDSGGKVELLLLRKTREKEWEAICRPGLKKGKRLDFGELKGEVTENWEEAIEIRFEFEGDFWKILEKIGKTPIPPYIQNDRENEIRKDYQTVYANSYGSAAAPTAGLHFTNELLEKLLKKGVQIEKVNLDVGLGTFKPVSEKNLERGKLHSEHFELRAEVADRLNLAKKQGKRIIAVGTTSVRVLEAMSDEKGNLRGGSGETDIFIYPPYKFKFVDSLLTNFHLPKSSLLMLVSALMGEAWREVYKEAVEKRYRFFSFGDAMWIR
ncbi:MAG: S-adenosylmethionine:tRNA ribosyltransferase-isomerase [Candidatus Shapirobacteria bacterium GW2011_GWE1_38_10]|uniref:S-adenosylmethionine:tRNA ribosyltransferase-isomerase n=1 Tax=Candidatus Shapirobacteria bacterium GW2011_GWE1_38_10 TaxID=1618488 RepID=A0A0G0I533_9BACT|nr:MAG: S-adenosylmethionine:tRNA ribosyltransferase-isomerase [Candidatus Shapirobacteria bacterium GW2011_GWF2_37_20]KKQ49637.1 MAG: S-adenosylmethionine:tRNA ribosyltransferase-isomerase [Candidatus Shapirobacteria bacterium GW2011_GWE1_38_10]KKQ64615.1 MAG: S-adenosylmethionine:tRNA ribosyltransferase-isomerase [Candidatus Shapirobacteria bacterium GW2011_GWF1_38_23]